MAADASHGPSAPPAPSDPLPRLDAGTPPTVRIRAGDVATQVDDTIAALVRTDALLFQRDGALVTVVRQPERTEVALCPGRESGAECASCGSGAGEPCVRVRRRGSDVLLRPGTPRIRVLGRDALYLRAAMHARWERYDARKGEGKSGGRGEWVTADPCPRTIAIIHGLGDWPGVRPLRGILETPTLAPSGRVLERAGYDDETGYLVLPSVRMDPVRERPTQAHARQALSHLWTEIACDFPFEGLGEAASDDPERRTHFIRSLECPDAYVGVAALLTLFARPAIDGAIPGAVFEAAGQGSGKSLQLHTIAMVATGRPAGVASFPMSNGRVDEAELEKVIMGYALAGARIVAFDNIRGVLSGSSLERALTSPDTIDGRVLGSNEQRSLPWSAISLFSGNNMVLNEDVGNRVIRSRLVSSREDPRGRPTATFRHANLLAAIKLRRADLVRACLTILRAYVVAREDGRAGPDATWGSYEAWSELIPPAIRWAGGPDVLRARVESGTGGDDESEAHAALVRGWLAVWDGQKASWIVGEMFRGEDEQRRGEAQPDGLDEVRAAVRALTRTRERETPSGHALGIALKHLRDKPRSGLRIISEKDRGNNVALWRVVKC